MVERRPCQRCACPGRLSRRMSGSGTAGSCRSPPGRRSRPAPRTCAGRRPVPSPSRAISASPRVISVARCCPRSPIADRDADAERDHVLDRPAELAADHVGVRVRPEVPGVALPLQLLGHVCPSDDHGGRTAVRRSPAPGSARRLPRCVPAAASSRLADHPAHPLRGAEFDPFHQARRAASAARDEQAPTRLRSPRSVWAGNRSTTRSAPSSAAASRSSRSAFGGKR